MPPLIHGSNQRPTVRLSGIGLIATVGALLPLVWPNGLTLVGLLFAMACFTVEVSAVFSGYSHYGVLGAVALALAANIISYVAWMALVLFVTVKLGGGRPAA